MTRRRPRARLLTPVGRALLGATSVIAGYVALVLAAYALTH